MPDTRYIDTADVGPYFAQFGSIPSEWSSATASEQLAATEVASRWLDQTFGRRWSGRRTDSTQVRDFPRTGLVDRDGYAMSSTTTPLAVRYACAEAAVLHLQGELNSIPTAASSERIASKTISAGDVSKSVTYIGGSSTSTSSQRTFPKIEALLIDVLEGGGGTVDHWPAFA